MSKKKDILFVMNNLNVGGAEKALLSLLQIFDYEKYNVDLLLFKKEGLFLNQLPKQVNLLDEPENFRYFDMPFSQVVKENFFKGKWNVIYRRIQFKIQSEKAKNPAEAEQFGWKPLSKTLKTLSKKYEVAIGFLEKNPNYFVVDKVDAQKKVAYMHNDYNHLKMNAKIDFIYFEKVNFIITVSAECYETLIFRFPEYVNRFLIINNVVSANFIKQCALSQKIEFGDGFTILSVGRLENQKGYTLAYDAVKLILSKYKFVKWVILGEGSQEQIIIDKIKSDGLENRIFLIGSVQNPYSYMSSANIFLHTANFEGDGIVVREAKILHKTIILTDFNTSKNHILNNFNGLIVSFNAREISEAIEKIIINPTIGETFSANLQTKHWGTEHEIEKLYQLIES